MKLLEFNADIMAAVPTEYASQIKEFRDIIRADSSRRTQTNQPKRTAVKELAAVYFFSDIESPYRQYEPETRWKKIGEAVFDSKDWKPNKLILNAVKRYEEMYRTPLYHLLEAAENAIYKLTDYYNNLDMQEVDDKGKYIHSAKSVIDSLANLSKVAKDLKSLKEMILSEQEDAGRIKGGFQLNEFNS